MSMDIMEATVPLGPMPGKAVPLSNPKRSKDTTNVEVVTSPGASLSKLKSELLSENSDLGPKDNGRVAMIVLRPKENERTIVEESYLCIDEGVRGSGWVMKPERGLTDQVCVMSVAAIRAIAGDDEQKWPPAGDQLFVDMDLSKDNMAVGMKLKIGAKVIVEVTRKPHTGCVKFSKRYGDDALKIVSIAEGRDKRLRGIYWAVVEPGMVKVGDIITKIEDDMQQILPNGDCEEKKTVGANTLNEETDASAKGYLDSCVIA